MILSTNSESTTTRVKLENYETRSDLSLVNLSFFVLAEKE